MSPNVSVITLLFGSATIGNLRRVLDQANELAIIAEQVNPLEGLFFHDPAAAMSGIRVGIRGFNTGRSAVSPNVYHSGHRQGRGLRFPNAR